MPKAARTFALTENTQAEFTSNLFYLCNMQVIGGDRIHEHKFAQGGKAGIMTRRGLLVHLLAWRRNEELSNSVGAPSILSW